MSRQAAFDILCALLAPTPFTLQATHEDTTYEWETLVAVASEHLVAPALWRPIADLPQATDDALQYFSAMHELNGDRNATLLGAVAQLVDGLGEIGIEPIFMKGVACLVAGLYDDPAERFLSDIDLLVPESQLRAAAARLHAMGYRKDAQAPDHWIEPCNHHLDVLIHPAIGAGVEIHRAPFPHPFTPILPVDDYVRQSKTLAWSGRNVRVPCETHRLIHNIAHEQLSHGLSEHGTTQLRQLRELALLATRERERIDWAEVERRFEQSGHLDVLRRHAATCAALMRVEMPLVMADPAEARARLSLSRQAPAPQSLVAKMRQLIRIYADGFRAEPRLALNLLNPRWWPARLRGWAEVLGLHRPRPLEPLSRAPGPSAIKRADPPASRD